MYFNVEELSAILCRHLPEFRIHPHDQYMPCSVDFFLENSELRSVHSNGHEQTLIQQGAITDSLLLEHQQQQLPQVTLRLHLDPRARCGAPRDALNEVPVYAHVKAIHSKDCDDTIEALEITYITLYAYNGAYTVGGVIKTGAHDGDIEHITIRVDPRGDLIGVWFNAHRPRDGQWVAAKDIETTHDGRPIAYVALNGHGVYPHAGTVLRHFFLGNDQCSGSGPVWRPRRVVLLPAVDSSLNNASGGNGSSNDNDGKSLRLLSRCRSRGSSLKEEVLINDAGAGTTGNPTRHSAMHTVVEDGASTICPPPITVHNNKSTSSDIEGVIADPCEWFFFKGLWGTTHAAICQGWIHNAETPVSRSAVLRIFGHIWPETHSL